MKKSEFKKALKELSGTDKFLCKEKIKLASDELKNSMINFLVRDRQAIVEDLLNEKTDRSWLSAMGYMYHFKNDKFSFLGTCEQQTAHNSREERKANTLSPDDRKQALKWYANDNYDLQTIADHFKIGVEALKNNLRTTFN
jgi:hypothetical protein